MGNRPRSFVAAERVSETAPPYPQMDGTWMWHVPSGYIHTTQRCLTATLAPLRLQLLSALVYGVARLYRSNGIPVLLSLIHI